MQDFFFLIYFVQLDRGAHKVSEKLCFVKKVLYIRNYYPKTTQFFVEIWGPTRFINRTTGISV